MRRLFFNGVAGCRLKTPVQVRYCKFCVISKNNYLVEHVQTVASDILRYPYVRKLLQGPYCGNVQFSPEF